jgi:putative transposase
MSVRRKSLRLPEYDYTEAGGYFITIVTHNRERLFGEIINGLMRLNEFGEIANKEWFRTAELRPTVELFDDEFVVMPDHIHGIIWIVETVGAERCSARLHKPKRVERRSTPTIKTGHSRSMTTKPPQPGSLGVIVRAYISTVAYQINRVRNTRGFPIWQRNYYEHVIRDDKDLDEICAYIEGNPSTWETDDPFQSPFLNNTTRIISTPK